MSKSTELNDIINRMKAYYDDNKLIMVLLLLKSNKIINLINDFLSMKNVDNNILDMIETIIICSKTLYESDVYCDPYDDKFYDNMVSKYKKYREEPFGDNALGIANATYKYDSLAGTLDKVHYIYEREKNDERESLETFIDNIPVDSSDIISVFVNEKKDGTSITVDYKYKNGFYVANSAISRGKRSYGEGTDVSMVAPETKFNPQSIKECLGYCPKYIGVQYEFLISKANKLALEEYLGQRFANCRSAAAGLMRRIIFAEDKERKKLKKFMSLVPVGFEILDKYKEKSYYKVTWNKLYVAVCDTFIHGDIDMNYDIIHGTKSQIMEEFVKLSEKALKRRSKLNHAIDGLVMTILDKDIQEKLGRSNNINKYQIAYKFPEEGEKTIIRGCTITTGNFGYKEILLDVDPVILNGTRQSKAQIHSLNKFRKMKLRIGDEIILKLSGDVIPYGYKDDSCRKGTGKKIKLPEYCECGSPLEEDKNKLRCTNKRCPFRIIGSLHTFLVELNAKGIGDKTCSQLYNELGVDKPSKLLKLNLDDFKSLKGFKEASAKLCMDTISDVIKRPRTIPAIISALGIDSFRTSTANKLFNTINIDELIPIIKNGEKDKLVSILKSVEGIDKNAIKIAEGLIDKYDELKELLSIMNIKNKDNKKYDKKILVSGIRHDDELEDIANNAGFEMIAGGTKYDILVIKDESYMNKSKAKFAINNNKPILTRDEFIRKYKGI